MDDKGRTLVGLDCLPFRSIASLCPGRLVIKGFSFPQKNGICVSTSFSISLFQKKSTLSSSFPTNTHQVRVNMQNQYNPPNHPNAPTSGHEIAVQPPAASNPTVPDSARHGNINQLVEFCIQYLTEITQRINPNARVAQVGHPGRNPSREVYISIDNHLVMSGQVSKSLEISALQGPVIDYAKLRTYRDITKQGFAFACSSKGQLLIQFYFVMRCGLAGALGNRVMDFETDRDEIEAILELCFRMFGETASVGELGLPPPF